jgi:hypothetical protein
MTRAKYFPLGTRDRVTLLAEPPRKDGSRYEHDIVEVGQVGFLVSGKVGMLLWAERGIKWECAELDRKDAVAKQFREAAGTR